MEHLAEHIRRILNDSRDGIEVDKLDVGTKLSVSTQNSVYDLVVLDSSLTTQSVPVEVTGGTLREGGTRYEEPVDGFFIGSTFGSSLLKLNWIGRKMCMEVCCSNSVLTTSPVKNVVIEAPDRSWAYSMDWNNEDQS